MSEIKGEQESREKTHLVKVLTAKPDDPSSVSRSLLKERTSSCQGMEHACDTQAS